MPPAKETNMTKDEATHLAREIAGHLGDGWTAVEDLDGYGVLGLLRNGDAEIGIRSDTWAPKGMLHLHGFRPRHLHEFWPYQSVPDSINVSPARPPVQIAREIRRRLLPRYEANLEARARPRRGPRRLRRCGRSPMSCSRWRRTASMPPTRPATGDAGPERREEPRPFRDALAQPPEDRTSVPSRSAPAAISA